MGSYCLNSKGSLVKKTLSLLSLSAAVALATSAGAQAQDEAPAGQDQSLFAQKGAIETVISSAQKKEESVQEVPLPVTAFSGVAIERKFAVNLEDLNKLAPSVQLQHVGARQQRPQGRPDRLGAATGRRDEQDDRWLAGTAATLEQGGEQR